MSSTILTPQLLHNECRWTLLLMVGTCKAQMFATHVIEVPAPNLSTSCSYENTSRKNVLKVLTKCT